MASNFDEMIDRRNTASLKWDVEENELPMWVADMDFATAPCVLEAMKKRLNHGIFGYTVIPEQWYEAYVGWWKKRHHFEMEKDWLVFCTGVVPAISSIVRKLTTPAEKVLIQTPVYNIFSIQFSTTDVRCWKVRLCWKMEITGWILKIWSKNWRILRQPL